MAGPRAKSLKHDFWARLRVNSERICTEWPSERELLERFLLSRKGQGARSVARSLELSDDEGDEVNILARAVFKHKTAYEIACLREFCRGRENAIAEHLGAHPPFGELVA